MRPTPLFAPLALTLLVAPLAAQDQDRLRNRITDLFTFGDCGAPLCLELDNAHGNHFIPAVAAGNETVIGFLTQAVATATGAVPISATSSGATFTIVGGLPVRTSTSAGPIFGERAQTLGRGRFFLGANVTSMQFTTLSGAPLDNLLINFQHQDVGQPVLGDPEFENDVIQLRLRLGMNLTVASVYATWGILDFVDLGVAVPFVRTTIDGASEAQILTFGNQTIHNFGGDPADPLLRAATAASGTATGIGDVAGRLKINLGQSRMFGAALLADVRFPTGNEEDLLGSGATSVRALGITSAQFGNFAPHLNVGYLARTGEMQNDAVLATVGFDNLMASWATVAVDLVSEWQLGENQIALPGEIQFEEPFVRELQAINVPNRRENLISASVGMKFNVRGGMVLVLNGIAPLRRAGLQPDFIWTAGIEGAF